MAGRLTGDNRKARDAVAAKLKKAQDRTGDLQPQIQGKRRADQNKRVADKIKEKGK